MNRLELVLVICDMMDGLVYLWISDLIWSYYCSSAICDAILYWEFIWYMSTPFYNSFL